MGIIFGAPNHKLVGTNEPLPGLYICADAEPSDGSRWLVYYWMSILITDILLLSLALVQAWRHRPSTGLGSALMVTLTRDSVVYFFVICTVYLASLVVWIFNRVTLNELLTSFSFVVSSILANRLLISLRREGFRCQPDAEIHSYMPSIRCAESLELTTILDTTPATTSTNRFRV
ncbi:hypothetical protein PM082_006411 [Marasmius tenuissimus]|nr:hypothetical protein PM082_006411 [Marasmius tenuissimus]